MPTKKPKATASTKTASQKRGGLESLASLFKSGALQKGSDADLIVQWVTTGIAMLDEIMGHGVPLNRWTELYGEFSAAKTLIAMLIAKSFQSLGLTVALVDAELAYDPSWWTTVGVDTEALIVSQPTSGEDAVDVIVALAGNVDLIIIDSLAAMIPLATQERDADESIMGRHPQLISRLFQKGNPALKKSGTAIIAINQVRSNFAPGGYDVIPGGKAQGFYSSVMLRLRRKGFNEIGGEKVGFVIEIYCSKNKLSTPYMSVELPFAFDGAFDFTTMLVSDAIDRRVIEQRSSWYRVPIDLVPTEHPPAAEDDPLDKWKPVAGDTHMQIMGRAALNAAYEHDAGARGRLEEATYRSGQAFAGARDDDDDVGAPAVGFAGDPDGLPSAD